MQRITKSIAASAEEWGISPRVAWIIALLPIITASTVLMSYASRPVYRFVTKEDGPIKWAQFLCYAAVCMFSIGIAYKRFKAGYLWQALMFAGFAFANFFITGEEIAGVSASLASRRPTTLR